MYHKRSLVDVILRRESIPDSFPPVRSVCITRGRRDSAIFCYGHNIKVFQLSTLSDLSYQPATEGDAGFNVVGKLNGESVVLMRVGTKALAEMSCAGIRSCLVPAWRKWGRRLLMLIGAGIFFSIALSSTPAGSTGGAQPVASSGRSVMPGFVNPHASQVKDGQFVPDLAGVDVPMAPALSCPEPTVN